MSTRKQIAIIGAGLSGAILSNRLSSQADITIYEKSRGTGGRIASCRLSGSSADLGTPWFKTTNSELYSWLLDQPGISHWQPVVADFSHKPTNNEGYLTATPRQSALTRDLCKGRLVTGTRISSIWPERQHTTTENYSSRVVVRDEHDKVLGYYDAVLITTPAEQAIPLLESVPRFSTLAINQQASPCWVTIIALDQKLEKPDIFSGDHPVFRRCIRNNAKPGRDNKGGDIWALEARSDWSKQNIEEPTEEITRLMIESFAELVGTALSITDRRSHRWLLANYTNTSTEACLWDPDTGIGACGDWFNKNGLEGSWQSSNQLAEIIKAELF